MSNSVDPCIIDGLEKGLCITIYVQGLYPQHGSCGRSTKSGQAHTLPMGKPEFPTTPINAKATSGTPPVEQKEFVQPTLDGLEIEQPPEIELGNCIVTAAVRFRKLVRGNEWHCTIRAEPDLLHPEQEGMFEAHAYQRNADMAQNCRLRPGDRALMRGTLHPQTIALGNGETTIVNHFSVTSIEVLARSKRTSITVYEQEKTR